MDFARAFYAYDSPIGLFAPHPVSAPAQQALLSSISRTLPPSYAKLAEGVDFFSFSFFFVKRTLQRMGNS